MRSNDSETVFYSNLLFSFCRWKDSFDNLAWPSVNTNVTRYLAFLEIVSSSLYHIKPSSSIAMSVQTDKEIDLTYLRLSIHITWGYQFAYKKNASLFYFSRFQATTICMFKSPVSNNNYEIVVDNCWRLSRLFFDVSYRYGWKYS